MVHSMFMFLRAHFSLSLYQGSIPWPLHSLVVAGLVVAGVLQLTGYPRCKLMGGGGGASSRLKLLITHYYNVPHTRDLTLYPPHRWKDAKSNRPTTTTVTSWIGYVTASTISLAEGIRNALAWTPDDGWACIMELRDAVVEKINRYVV